jgi:hypothetical protein
METQHMNTPRYHRRHGREPSEAAMRAFMAANDRIERERDLPSGFFASAGPMLRSKAQLRDLLRDAGLAKGAAERVASAGWPALSPANAAADVAASIRAAVRTLKP